MTIEPHPLSEYLDRLRAAGVVFDVAADLIRDDDAHPLVGDRSNRRRVHRLSGDVVVEEEADTERGICSDHATMSVLRVLERHAEELAGRRVIELGCGTGLLAIAAARYGAEVIVTDVDERALELCRDNAAKNGVVLDVRAGSLGVPVRTERDVDWVIANLPHKPGTSSDGLPLSQAGGRDGSQLFEELMPDLLEMQEPGGRLVFFLHSLPSPKLLGLVAENYALELQSWKLRHFAADEYGALRDVFRARHAEHMSYVHRHEAGESLVAAVWLARRREAAS